MKLDISKQSNNVFPMLLELLPGKDPILLTTSLIDKIITVLHFGGVTCESREEAIDCLVIMEELDIIDIIKDVKPKGTTFSIGNKYSGK